MAALTILYEIFDICNVDIVIYNNIIFYYINKQSILYWLNILNFLNYTIYKYTKFIIINLYYYIIQWYIMFIHSNMPNIFLKNYYYIFYKLKKYLKYIYKRFIKRKKKKIRKYYRFFTIGYLKFILLLLIIVIWYLMRKKHTTYHKYSYILIAVKFFFMSIFISGIMLHLCANQFLSVIISLFLSFMIIYLQLN